MNRRYAFLGVGLIAGALLLWRAAEPPAPSKRLAAALDAYERIQAQLERDIVSLRAGLLHNYDPLVLEVTELEAADRDLEAALTESPALRREASVFASATARQAALTELLKSNSALLQNSLAYVSRLSSPAAGAPNPPGEVSALAAAMLRLTLDTSPDNEQEVARRLRAVEAMRGGDREGRLVLLEHARLIEHLLPATDEALRAMRSEDAAGERRNLRVALQQEIAAEDARGVRVRIALTLLSGLLLALLLDVGLRLRDRMTALRRRARLELIVAEISTSLIRAQPEEVYSAVLAGLDRIGRELSADRAYLLGEGPFTEAHVWSRDSAPFPEGWAEQALALFITRAPAPKGAWMVAHAHMASPETRRLLLAAGLEAATAVWATTEDGDRVLLGFDAARALRLEHDELDVLRLALDILAGAVRRCALERQRSELERRLEAASRMEAIGVFASGIAHNFNNILAAIGGYAEMAGEGSRTGDPAARQIAEVLLAVARGRDLVDRILAFGRRRAMPLEPVAVLPLLEECASLLRAAHEGARIRVSRGADPGRCWADPGALEQIILNLGANAIQAAGDEVRFRAASHTIERRRALISGELAPGDYVVLTVEDDGGGIEPRLLPRIFDPFFTTRRDGHGLGLATVGALVRDHGGAIDVASEPGRGSRFDVWLPCGHAAADSGERGRGKGEALLLVCQEAEVLRHAEELVAALGYEPVGFVDLADALDAAQRSAGFEGVLVLHCDAATARRWATALRAAVPGRSPIVATGGRAAAGLAARLGFTPLPWPADPAALMGALRSAAAGSRPA